jgi:hypothetical protein|tara:strand:+ start:1206 stop:1385 length:180 start_codon:yes stop_codon:yes gene_type:complete
MSAPLANIRLPQPPRNYDQSYMARLLNTLELLQRDQSAASSVSSNITSEKSEATAWFLE